MGAGESVPSKRKLQSIIFLKLYNNDRSKTVKQRLYEAFEETDSSGDGLISKTEFSEVIAKLGLNVQEPKCSNIFDVFDADSSGQIDRTEFLDFMGYADKGDVHETIQSVRRNDTKVGKMMDEELMSEKALRLEVYRKVPGRGLCFVGQVGYDDSRLLDFPENISTKVEQTLREKPEDCDQSLVGGDLQYRITRMSVLTVSVKSAKGLAKADMMGKSDPFVVVKMNNEPRLTTAAMKQTLDPVWQNESVTLALPTHPKKLGKTSLQFEVYDKDVMGSDFLGKFSFDGDAILSQSDGKDREYQLVGKAGVQTKKQKGSLTISLHHVKQMRVAVAEVRKLIDPAKLGGEQPVNDEEQPAEAVSEVHCKVMWKDEQIGQTGDVACTGSSSVEWEDNATFTFPLPTQ